MAGSHRASNSASGESGVSMGWRGVGECVGMRRLTASCVDECPGLRNRGLYSAGVADLVGRDVGAGSVHLGD